ncbi:hypothetical protein Tco_0065481 [Tanacetum coccineum]
MDIAAKGTNTLKSCLKASKIRNIEGKIIGKDGNPLIPVRQVARVSNLILGNNNGDGGKKDQVSQGASAASLDSAPDENHDSQNVNVQNSWEDSNVHAMKTSLVSVVLAEHETSKLNFKTLLSTTQVEEADCVLPVENIMVAQNKFANSLKVIQDDDDVFYFKFTSVTRIEQVLEQGPWMILNQPLILTKWSPNLTLSKDKVTKVPGRIGYARALIEVSADKELKKEVTMAILIVNGEGHTKETMKVEYKWKPSCCGDCHVFGHALENCPKRLVEPVKETNEENEEGFTTIKSHKRKAKPKPKTTFDEGINIVQLRNTFNALQDQDDVERLVELMKSIQNWITRSRPMEQPMERRTLWADLDMHKYVVRGFPWVLMGDFNVALNIEDSYSGSSMMNSAMCGFKDCVKKIEVIDINSYGLHFTWNQKPKGSNRMCLRSLTTLGTIVVPNLSDRDDSMYWHASNGALSVFSVKYAWEALRPRGPEDKLRPWDIGDNVDLSSLRMETVPPILDAIVDWFRPMASKRTFKSIVGKLLFAATAYYIWSERNNRIFKNTRRSPEELKDIIMVVVRLKLVTFRFKNKMAVISMLLEWKMPNTFRLY